MCPYRQTKSISISSAVWYATGTLKIALVINSLLSYQVTSKMNEWCSEFLQLDRVMPGFQFAHYDIPCNLHAV